MHVYRKLEVKIIMAHQTVLLSLYPDMPEWIPWKMLMLDETTVAALGWSKIKATNPTSATMKKQAVYRVTPFIVHQAGSSQNKDNNNNNFYL